MTDQPTPRAPEQEAVVRDVLEEWLHRAHGVLSSHIHADWFIDWLGERGYGVAPEPPAPNDLAEQIGHALETARCTHHESDACYDCEADAVMDVLRRNGVSDRLGEAARALLDAWDDPECVVPRDLGVGFRRLRSALDAPEGEK